MKQVKFLMVALTILMGTMVTSCMNGETDPMVSGTNFMRIKSGDGLFSKYVFEAGENLTFTATNTIDKFEASRGDIALVYWRYDSSLQEVNQNTKNVDVEVLGANNITSDFSVAEAEGEMGDVESNVPVMTLEPNTMKPGFYDKNNLILSIGHKAEADLSKHKFTLVYLETEEVEEKSDSDTTLKLYLRHVTSEDMSKETKNGISYCAFDFSRALSLFNDKNGKNPTKIVVVVKENSDANKLEDAKDREYSLDYNFKD